MPDKTEAGTTFHSVVKNKYYANLGQMCRTVLDAMEHKIDTLRIAFLSVAY
jgi:hypothetical protein